MLRQVRNRRPVRTGLEQRTDIPAPTDVKEDRPHEYTASDLIPQIQARTRNAVAVDRVDLYLYQRKLAGRRCSCFMGGDTSPDGLCQVCWGTGIATGYEKFGTRAETVDVTFENLRMVNVHPAYELGTRPVLFCLDEGSTQGYIEATVPVIANEGILDCVSYIYPTRMQTGIAVTVRGNTELLFVDATTAAVESRLKNYNALVFRISMSRRDHSSPLPLFSHIFLRYNLITDLKIQADQPRQTESIALSELGIFEQYQAVNYFFDATKFNNFSTQDFVIRLRDMRRFKLIEVQKNEPLGIATSTDVVTRLVQEFDVYYRIP